MESTIVWQRIEGALVFACLMVLLSLVPELPAWWVSLLIFLAPDVSFAGYLFGPKIGALIYNLLHTYATGLLTLLLGFYFSAPLLTVSGLLWVAHCGFDRMLGYGLKKPEGFKHTHLGTM